MSDTEDRKDYENPRIPSWRYVFNQIYEVLPEKQRTHNNKNNPKDWPIIWTAIATVVISVATVVSVVVGIRQWHALRDTISEMRDEQRPWVYPEIAISGPLMFKNGGFKTKFDIPKFVENAQNFPPPLSFNSMLPIKLLVKNVGKLPALNVFASAKLAFGSHFLSIDSVNGQNVQVKTPGLSNDDVKGECGSNEPKTDVDVLGTVVFSDQQNAFFDTVAVGNADRSPDTEYIRLIACVSYYFNGSTTLHTTIFFFDVNVNKARAVGDTFYFDQGEIKMTPSLILSRAN